MTRAPGTLNRHWLLLGCVGIATICTLASGFCLESEITMTMCEIRRTCNNGTCEVDLTSSECNVTCDCSGSNKGGIHCDVPLNDVTTQPSHHANSSTETTDNTTTHPSAPTTSGQVTVPKKCGSKYTCDHGYCTTGKLPCECEPEWDGPLCDKPCNKSCLNGAICKINATDAQYCNCIHTYTGEFCDILITTAAPLIITRTVTQKEEADYRYIAGVVVGAVLFVLAVTTILCVILWKRRAIIILKLIYWFKPYEDDDYKLYDAFVSYKSSHSDGSHGSSPEEQFVIHTLMPKLEQELGFRLCVHFRDFLPGRHITENVLDAIENSRRTILLLSKNYIENSFWTRFEYEQAQVAAMERKQRIIPIIFEDISDAQIQDHTLQNILDSITYITWPGQDGDSKKLNKFWTQLTLSMPKLMTSETVAPVNYKETSYVEMADSAISKATVSNGPYISQATELQDIAIDISHNKSKTNSDLDPINNKDCLGDRKGSVDLQDHSLKEQNLKAKAGEYAEILEGSV